MEITKVSINRGMDKDVVHLHNGILHSHNRNETLPFATTWMDLEGAMLREISKPRKTNTVYYHLYVESKK